MKVKHKLLFINESLFFNLLFEFKEIMRMPTTNEHGISQIKDKYYL